MVATGNFQDWRDDSGVSVATGVSVVAIKGKAFEAAKVTLHPGTELGHHSHPEDQFFYILEGKLKYHVGDEESVVGPGQCIFMPGDTGHGGTAVGDVPTVFIEIKELAGI